MLRSSFLNPGTRCAARLFAALVIGVITFVGKPGWSQPGPVQIVVGAGFPPPWVSEYTLANRQPYVVFVDIGAYPFATRCENGVCLDRVGYRIPPDATITVPGPPDTFPSMIEVVAPIAQAPVVRARIYDRNDPSRSLELPVKDVDELMRSLALQLVIPLRSGRIRTNLLLLNPSTSDPSGARIDYLSQDGTHLARRDVVVPASTQIYLVDLNRIFEIQDSSSAQIRITRMGGPLWAMAVEVSSDEKLTLATPSAR